MKKSFLEEWEICPRFDIVAQAWAFLLKLSMLLQISQTFQNWEIFSFNLDTMVFSQHMTSRVRCRLRWFDMFSKLKMSPVKILKPNYFLHKVP